MPQWRWEELRATRGGGKRCRVYRIVSLGGIGLGSPAYPGTVIDVGGYSLLRKRCRDWLWIGAGPMAVVTAKHLGLR